MTTHSPYFISGQGFESVRMTRKSLIHGKTKISQYTHSELSKKLAEALGESPRNPTATMAAVEQIMQPSKNDLFFSRVPILVEGTEDVALIATNLRLMQKWDDFRRYGCHLIICEGKSQMSRPLAIASGLNIPFFSIFDGDSNKCETSDRKNQHERDNGCLIKLCGKDMNPIPSKNYFGDNLVIWKTNFLTEVIDDFGSDTWEGAESEVRKKQSLLDDIQRKHPLLVTATIENLWNNGSRSSNLQKTCDKILEYSAKFENE